MISKDLVTTIDLTKHTILIDRVDFYFKKSSKCPFFLISHSKIGASFDVKIIIQLKKQQDMGDAAQSWGGYFAEKSGRKIAKKKKITVSSSFFLPKSL